MRGANLQFILNSYIYKLRIMWTNKQQIKELLKASNLNLDLASIQEIYAYLQQHFHELPEGEEIYHIYSAVAVVSELRRIPSVATPFKVFGGLKIQNIIRHLPKLSKEQFLCTLATHANRYVQAPRLKMKIQQVSLAYRLYKKYCQVFSNLSAQLNHSPSVSHQLMYMFWIIYLIIKGHFSIGTEQKSQILLAVIKSAFGRLFGYMQRQTIEQAFQSVFQRLPSAEDALELQAANVLSEAYQLRKQTKIINSQYLLTNPGLIQRIVDDLSNRYQRQRVLSGSDQVNQVLFLELDKSLTPMSIHHAPKYNNTPIAGGVDFTNDDDDIEGTPEVLNTKTEGEDGQIKTIFLDNFFGSAMKSNTQSTMRKAISPFYAYKATVTPISNRINTQQWVRDCTDQIFNEQIDTLSALYQQKTASAYPQFQFQSGNYIIESIKRYQHPQRIKASQKEHMYLFFVYLVWRIIQEYTQQDKAKIFATSQSFRAILCLSVDIYNYFSHSLQNDYIQNCILFRVEPTLVFRHCKWLQKGLLPQHMQPYLYNLEKKLLLCDIWKNQIGYNLITEDNKQQNGLLLGLLYRHTIERAQQLGKQLKLQGEIVSKIGNLLELIFKNLQGLLRNNRLDQIIICATNSLQALNNSRQKHSLDNTFKAYSNMQFWDNFNRCGMQDQYGNIIGFSQFYNQKFLPQLAALTTRLVNNENYTQIFTIATKENIAKKFMEGDLQDYIKERCKDHLSDEILTFTKKNDRQEATKRHHSVEVSQSVDSKGSLEAEGYRSNLANQLLDDGHPQGQFNVQLSRTPSFGPFSQGSWKFSFEK